MAAGRSLTSRRETTPVLAGQSLSHFCGCSSVGRARPCHGRGHEFETRHPLHVGCVRAKARVRRRACARPRCGPRAADHLVHRVVRVWAQPTWIICLVRLAARTPGFHLGNTGSIPVRDTTTIMTTRSPRRSRASRAEIGRNDRAAPEPVTGRFTGCSSAGRASALQAEGRRFDPDHFHHPFGCLAERPIAAACKAASSGRGGSNPSTPTSITCGRDERSNAPLTQWPECRPV